MLDEYQWQEFDEKIHYAMTLTLPIKLTVWEGGYFKNYMGIVHRVCQDSFSNHVESSKQEN
ncbi:YolD-like family protein [Peribacillus huizhouensis]|uniref:YolD-like family protein n=1 Tax=Peribacillus huizhouensis TaxID=1501239 RepID=UPI0015F861FF